MVRQALAPTARSHSTAVAKFSSLQDELRNREKEIGLLLPSHVDRERFLNAAIVAAKNNPKLTECNRRSLHAALTKAAEDGLLPDGREGVINCYGNDATWIPMTYGIRKRAREICGIIIDAQVVHANDHFVWHQGDDPKIEHRPAPLGTERGQMVGAYAIIKIGEEILHREVMDKTAIERVKSISKAQGGLLWTKFEAEAWRKTVVRRAVKTIPSVHPKVGDFQRIVARDDDNYDVSDQRAPVLDVPADIPDAADDSTDVPSVANPEKFLAHLAEEYDACGDLPTLDACRDAYIEMIESMSGEDMKAAANLYKMHHDRVCMK